MALQTFLKCQECCKRCLRGQNLKNIPRHHGRRPHQKLMLATLAIQSDGVERYYDEQPPPPPHSGIPGSAPVQLGHLNNWKKSSLAI